MSGRHGPALERFVPKVEALPSGCWLWVASLNETGYGQLYLNERRKPIRAYRFAYETLIGPVPHGRELDHLCRESRCVNPLHLEPVTHRENVRRGAGPSGVNARKDACSKGHPFDGRFRNHRFCVTCRNAWRRERKRAQAA